MQNLHPHSCLCLSAAFHWLGGGLAFWRGGLQELMQRQDKPPWLTPGEVELELGGVAGASFAVNKQPTLSAESIILLFTHLKPRQFCIGVSPPPRLLHEVSGILSCNPPSVMQTPSPTLYTDLLKPISSKPTSTHRIKGDGKMRLL